jgi:glycosyltransferase involved in cell wall biosynthesis
MQGRRSSGGATSQCHPVVFRAPDEKFSCPERTFQEILKMTSFPIFLSVVLVVRNEAYVIEKLVSSATAELTGNVDDYEIIIVDNASTDETVSILKNLTRENGHPNLQVYALTKEVDSDTASWVGLENALGDFVAVINPMEDDIGFLPAMLEKAATGMDVVFAANRQKIAQSLAYRFAYIVFDWLYVRINGIHLANDAPQYRVLSKRVVNFILQHQRPTLMYRQLPATAGFARLTLNYSAKPQSPKTKRFWESVDRGMLLLLSSTRAPMRVVTALSLFGAMANVVYSMYVVAVAFLNPHVAPGWASLSLQQSGMFLLISLVLLVLGEYILQMAGLSNEGPLYHIGQEFTSVRVTRREKLNIDSAQDTNRLDSTSSN